jgi:hypothetical protein
MNRLFKTLIAIIVILFVFPVLEAEKRIPLQVSLDDLSDPSSPSYVPNPYPKSEQEIIENLKYRFKRTYSPNSWRVALSKTGDLLKHFAYDKPGVNVTEIVKVKNRISLMHDDYSYLIIITDKKGKLTAKVAMKSNGLVSMYTDPTEENPGTKLRTYDQVIEKMNKYFKKADVRSIERVAFGIAFASISDPIYEITLQDGSVYYYDDRDNGYFKSSQKKLKGKNRSEKLAKIRLEKRKLKKDERHLFDMINNSFIILKKLKK